MLIALLSRDNLCCQTTGMDTIGLCFTTARYLIGAIALLPALMERRKISLQVHLQTDRRLCYRFGLGVMFGGIPYNRLPYCIRRLQRLQQLFMCRQSRSFCSFFCGNQSLAVFGWR